MDKRIATKLEEQSTLQSPREYFIDNFNRAQFNHKFYAQSTIHCANNQGFFKATFNYFCLFAFLFFNKRAIKAQTLLSEPVDNLRTDIKPNWIALYALWLLKHSDFRMPFCFSFRGRKLTTLPSFPVAKKGMCNEPVLAPPRTLVLQRNWFRANHIEAIWGVTHLQTH